jgi:hypothetical protein
VIELVEITPLTPTLDPEQETQMNQHPHLLSLMAAERVADRHRAAARLRDRVSARMSARRGAATGGNAAR